MTILIDASAIVAMLTDEPDGDMLADELGEHADRLFCATGLWEATLAIARKRKVSLSEAQDAIARMRSDFSISIVPVGEAETAEAVRAHARYGKGTGHRAKLNMGDCFAYACARTNDAKLLYKGDDFSHTDLA